MRVRVIGHLRAWSRSTSNSDNEEAVLPVAPPPRAEREQPSQGGAETAAVAAGGSDAEAEADQYAEGDYFDIADNDALKKSEIAAVITASVWSDSKIAVSETAVAATGKTKPRAQGEVSITDTNTSPESEDCRKETSTETMRH